MQYKNEIILVIIAGVIGYGVNYVLTDMQTDAEAGDNARIASAPAVQALADSVNENADAINDLALTAAAIEANQQAIVANQNRIFQAITQNNGGG